MSTKHCNITHIFFIWVKKNTRASLSCCSATRKVLEVLNFEFVFLQVSFLWEMLQWDPGGERDIRRWPCTATDVSELAIDKQQPCSYIHFFCRWPPHRLGHYVKCTELWTEGLPVHVCIVFLISFSLFSSNISGWYQKTSLNERRMMFLTLNRKYTPILIPLRRTNTDREACVCSASFSEVRLTCVE